MAKAIGTLGTVETLTVGSRVFTDLVNLITLSAYVSSTNGSTMRKPGIATGYQVTTGKTFTLAALRLFSNAAGTINFAQSDNDVGMNTATAMTNPVYYNISGAVIPTSGTGSFTSPGAGMDLNPNFPVAATKYLTIYNVGAATNNWQGYGYEA